MPDEALEGVGAAMGGFDGEEVGGIVAPGAVAGEFVDGHELDGGDAQRLEVGDLLDAFIEGGGQPVLGVVGSGMHFIDDQVVSPDGAEIGVVAPIKRGVVVDDGIAGGIDDAPAAGILLEGAVDGELVLLAGAGAGDIHGPRAAGGVAGQGGGAPPVEGPPDADGRRVGRPGAEGDAGAGRVGVGDGPDAAAGGLGEGAGGGQADR